MNIPKLAIHNYRFVFVLIVIGILIGSYALLNMPRSEDPKPDFPVYTIIAVYPGTGPEDMEELIVNPLEDALEEVDEIDQVNTRIEDGLAIIQVDGEFGIDTDEKYDEIVREINAASTELPDDLHSLDILQYSPNKRVSIQQFALVSPKLPYNELNDLAEVLEMKLERISGVSAAEVHAAPQEEIRISLDYQRMAQQHISLKQLIGVLQGNNYLLPGGDVNAGNRSFTIKSSGTYRSLEELKQTVVGSNQAHLVYLKDIAEVDFAYEDLRWKASYMGDKCIYITLTQKDDVNLIHLAEEIQLTADEFSSSLPESVQLYSVFEQAPAVQARIQDFFSNLLQGVFLVGAIILLFLGFRSSIIIVLVIPLSILLAIGSLQQTGFALQQISIAALVIALGLLVDNGIVVLENIVRYIKRGYTVKEAAMLGTQEVSSAIISSTITTLLAFGPLTLLNSGAGEFLRSLPITVILVLCFSLILALSFSPIAAGLFLKPSVHKKRWIDAVLEKVIHRLYRPTLNFALRRSWLTLTIALIIFFGSLMLFPQIGVSFFPTADKALLLIEVETPEGSNVEETDRAVQFVASVLDTTALVKDYVTNAGHGNPTIYYNRVGEEYKKNHGQLLVNFTHWDAEKFYQTLAEFRKAFAHFPAAEITFSELKNGPPFEAPIEIKIIGNHSDTLKRLSFLVEEAITNTEGTLNVKNPLALNKTNLKIDINKDKAAMLNLPLADIDLSIRASLAGLTVDKLTLDDGEEYPLVLRMPVGEHSGIENLEQLYISTQSNTQVPLKQVATVTYESAPKLIQHYDFQRSIAVTSNVVNPDKTTEVTLRLIEKLEQISFPKGYSYYVAGEYEAQQETFGDLGALLILAMVGIFAILVLQFRSLVQPLIIFSAIPLAITGSFVALYLSGWSFSFFAFVGFISLVGIVVNNSIILVDYSNQMVREGKSVIEAVKEAAETRFTPILLTTTTTILGLLPLTLSNTSLWSPLGWTIIGGMISSTFLTLLIVPLLYRWFTRKSSIVVAETEKKLTSI